MSLSFDDGRKSQVDAGVALFDKHNVKATFYVVPSAVERQLEGWKKIVASGHYGWRPSERSQNTYAINAESKNAPTQI